MGLPFRNVDVPKVLVKCVDFLDFCRSQGEIVYVDVFVDSGRSCGLWNRYNLPIDQISEDDLDCALFVFVSDFGQCGIVDGWRRSVLLLLGFWDGSKRSEGYHSNFLLFAKFGQFLLSQGWVHL